MEYSEQYLTYEEFKAMGGTIDLVPFNIVEEEAKLIIDRETFNRFRCGERPNELKLCMNKLINTIKFDASYLDADEDEKRKIENRILHSYLINVKVNNQMALYRGLDG